MSIAPAFIPVAIVIVAAVLIACFAKGSVGAAIALALLVAAAGVLAYAAKGQSTLAGCVGLAVAGAAVAVVLLLRNRRQAEL